MGQISSLLNEKKWKQLGWEAVFQVLQNEVSIEKIEEGLRQIEEEHRDIFPPQDQLFKAFEFCSFPNLKVVILGQDPYHHPRQAHGLSFSVPDGIKVPPSLRNIYKAIHQDLGKPIPSTGNLSSWARQGVLLLNAILTVSAFKPSSHRKIGWEAFTDKVIQEINARKVGVVFMLWGNFARSKAKLIDPSKHLILEAPHPSPLSAHQGFFTCGHFSKCNSYLVKQGKSPIDWSIQSQSFLNFPEDQDKA